MKRIYLFGRTLRILFLISLAFLVCCMFDIVKNDFDFFNLFLLVISICFAAVWSIYIYSLGIFIDRNKDKLRIVTGFSKKATKECVLSNIVSINVELDDNLGMIYVINYKYNCVEKIEYKFYRISFFEKSQYKRIKKELANINQSYFSE
ncbi:MAG: hypothetical protein IKM18_04870 [Clostridia bacterium]|nr:hypothetical protein [Clostridia bacterium]